MHSTETALLKVHNHIALALDQGNSAVLVMLDLSAAFDTIDHAILLNRLEHHYGLASEVKDWVVSYLGGRRKDHYSTLSHKDLFLERNTTASIPSLSLPLSGTTG